jgi:hypothetical protein
MKICNKCKEPKDYSAFNKSARFSLYPTCKECISKRRKQLKTENVLKIKTELHKIVLVENKILKQQGLSQCHTPNCRAEIPMSKSNHYCKDCEKAQRERDKEKVLASKKAYRDRNKEKQKAYRDSRKEIQREYDARRYQLQKEDFSRKNKERYKKRKAKNENISS